MMPRRVSPGAEPGAIVTFTRSDESSWPRHGSHHQRWDEQQPAFSRSALWLCRMCSHQWPTTYSGMKTVTTVRFDSAVMRLT